MYNEPCGESIQQTDGQVMESWSLLSQQKFAFPVKLWETRQVSDLHGWEGFTDINLKIFMCENICQDYTSYFPEVHLLWAQHQVHHSSEEYNLAVGLRQSALQGWCGFVCFCNFVAITNDRKLSQTPCVLPHSFQLQILHRLQHVFTIYTNHVAYTSPSYH